jgi:C4-dicarboxylate transporter
VLPALLAVAVITAHEIWPTIAITQIIAISAPLLVIVVLLFEGHINQLHVHITNRLANMHNEIILFLAAGVFAIGLGELFMVMPPWLPFSHYGPLEACLTLGFCLIAARLGVHVIMIMAVIAPLLLTLEPNPNLLAMTFLSAWGLGSSINPVSGTLLAMQGNYNIKGSQIARANTLPIIALYAINCITFFIYSALN